jgi:2TM domain-containing protein
LWALHEWYANGAFERFAHAGNQGDWNPTLLALVVGVWGLVVGIGALRVRFERSPTAAEVDREVEQSKPHTQAKLSPAARRRRARERLERIGRLRFHVAAWVLGMVVIAPLNALVEWQDNGGFRRVSGNSQPGSWDPWVLYIGGIWALVVAISALNVYVARHAKEATIERGADARVHHGPRTRLSARSRGRSFVSFEDGRPGQGGADGPQLPHPEVEARARPLRLAPTASRRSRDCPHRARARRRGH